MQHALFLRADVAILVHVVGLLSQVDESRKSGSPQAIFSD
jgi:hypothetical protein